jgi:hypothetical protein
MIPSYNLGKIRALLTEGFNDEELRALCFDWPEFKSVYHELAQNMGKKEIVSRLLESAERTHQLAKLLELAKAHNPAKYDENEPYTYADSTAESPYRGLQYFDVGDAGLFFGREQLTAKLVGRLTSSPAFPLKGGGSETGGRFLAIVGASGSGKSSVVRAGLVPALRSGQPLADGSLPPEGSIQWSIHIITPTAHPLEALAASLTRESESVTSTATLIDDMGKDPRSLHLYIRKLLTHNPTPSPALPLRGGGRILLVADQFEELFTLCRNEEERRAFVDNLLAAVDPETDGPTIVVITLRADFYAHCTQYDNLREALAQRQEYIGPMSPEELRRAIEMPAQRAGYGFEPGLVELILRDVGDEPGALPLLSHALLETWRRRQGRTLTLAGYADAGGVRGAIAQTAESVFGHLTPEQQAIARRIFLRLTELGEGAQDTRRRVSRTELEMMTGDRRPETGDLGEEQAPVAGRPPVLSEAEGSPVAAVLQTLVAARLVTTDQGTAEVAHEALIREWPTLRQWLNDNREGLRLHRQLSEAAQEWQRLNRDPGVLYRGAKLAQAGEWAEQHPAELNAAEWEFLTASKQAEENERLRELEQARALAEEQQRRAEAERQRAEEQKQAAANLRKRALIATGIGVIALIAAIAAGFFAWRATEQEAEARNQADRATAHLLAAEGRLQFEEKPLLGLRLAMEGWALSSAYDQIDQSIREMAQHGRLLTFDYQGDVEAIRMIADNPSTFLLDRVNAPTELRRTAEGALIATLPDSVDFSRTYSLDKNRTYFLVRYSDNTPGEVRQTANGTVVPLSGPVETVVFSPDPATAYFLVTYSDGTPAELRRTSDHTLITTLSGSVDLLNNVIFSPDVAVTYFLVSYNDGPTELRRTIDGTVVPLSGPVFQVWFSPDEAMTYFMVRYRGNATELHHSADGTVVPLSGPVSNVIFSPHKTGGYFIVQYADNTSTELRRISDGQLISTLSDSVESVIFSPDPAATYFVVIYANGAPGELRRTANNALIKTLSSAISYVTFSPDAMSTYFVATYKDGTATELRRAANGTVVPLSGPISEYSVTFSSDRIATYFLIQYSDNTPAELRRADDDAVVPLAGQVSKMTFNETHSYVLIDYSDGTPAEIRHTVDSVVIPLSGPVSGLIFSPDKANTYFVVGYINNVPAELRRTADGLRLATLSDSVSNISGLSDIYYPPGVTVRLYGVNFSPDSVATYFVVTYSDKQSELWQARGESYRLTKLGLGLADHYFDVGNDRLILRYSDGRTYLVDLAWLQAMGGQADKLPIEELVRLACEGPFSSGLFDEAELKPYLGEREPQACKK